MDVYLLFFSKRKRYAEAPVQIGAEPFVVAKLNIARKHDT
jgi:hypothetical protein